MTAKEYLEQVHRFNQQIVSKKAELESYRELSLSISGGGFEQNYNASRNTSAPFERYSNKIMDLEREIQEDLVTLGNMKFEVGLEIDKLDCANERLVHQWDIWFARLGRHPYSSVQEGERPVLIVSNDKNNRFANTVTVVPFTTKMKKLDMPTHVVVGKDPAWKNGKASMALVEQMTTIDKRRLVNREGAVSRPETIEQLKSAVLMQLGLKEDSDETQ